MKAQDRQSLHLLLGGQILPDKSSGQCEFTARPPCFDNHNPLTRFALRGLIVKNQVDKMKAVDIIMTND